MNRSTANAFKKEMKSVLEALASKHGLSVEIGSGSFTSSSITTKVIFSEGSKDEVEKAEFQKYAKMFGLEGEYGTKFNVGKYTYRLCKIKPRNRTYPIIAERVDNGAMYKFPESTVSHLSTRDSNMFGLAD